MSNAGSDASCSGGSGGKQEPKPAAVESPSHITLKVLSQDGKVLNFRLKRNVKLRKLMEAYSDRLKVDMNTYVFLHDGVKLSPDDTPNELELEDGAEIDAMLHQDGGLLH